MTQQTERFDDVQLQCKQQITLMLKREQRGPQRRYGCFSHFVLTEEPRKLLIASINSVSSCPLCCTIPSNVTYACTLYALQPQLWVMP